MVKRINLRHDDYKLIARALRDFTRDKGLDPGPRHRVFELYEEFLDAYWVEEEARRG
jgi:hypothetical protein